MTAKRPTRRDLLLVIGQIQDLVGKIQSVDHDRNQQRADDKAKLFPQVHKLCVLARSFDPPLEGEWP